MTDRLKNASRFLSLLLRHQPEKLGLQLDPEGWIDIPILLAALSQTHHKLDRQQLQHLVETNDKKRFAISPDGLRIRASQGHSVPIQLNLPPRLPPDQLFHGTVEKFLPSIMSEGLRPGSRHHVHLSPDRQTATAVGQRRGAPIILTIDANAMQQAGFVFHVSENGVWLTDHVPPEFLRQEH